MPRCSVRRSCRTRSTAACAWRSPRASCKISAHNPEQEEAQEEVEADTKVDDLAVGFNVNYLLDALTALKDEHVVIALRDANSSALVREAANDRCRHVVMPLRL